MITTNKELFPEQYKNIRTHSWGILSFTTNINRLSLQTSCLTASALSTAAWGEDMTLEVEGSMTTAPLSYVLPSSLSRDPDGNCYLDLWLF